MVLRTCSEHCGKAPGWSRTGGGSIPRLTHLVVKAG
uniref:Uncharacterized protein n=1 Tax=Arundo donax TaxID=35708 RepID=A0A0A8ZPB8_ARUDO